MRVRKFNSRKVRDKGDRVLVLEITVGELQCLLSDAIDMVTSEEGRLGQLDQEEHETRDVYQKLFDFTMRPAGKMVPTDFGNPHEGY